MLTMNKILEPESGIEVKGYNFKGRGPSATGNKNGWRKSESLYFRCAKCGSMIPSIINDYYTCECCAMHHDLDAFRFGSTLGDKNILVYEIC